MGELARSSAAPRKTALAPNQFGARAVRTNGSCSGRPEALAPVGMAGHDGAFVALQSEVGRPVSAWMDQFADSIAALGAAVIAAD